MYTVCYNIPPWLRDDVHATAWREVSVQRCVDGVSRLPEQPTAGLVARRDEAAANVQQRHWREAILLLGHVKNPAGSTHTHTTDESRKSAWNGQVSGKRPTAQTDTAAVVVHASISRNTLLSLDTPLEAVSSFHLFTLLWLIPSKRVPGPTWKFPLSKVAVLSQ